MKTSQGSEVLVQDKGVLGISSLHRSSLAFWSCTSQGTLATMSPLVLFQSVIQQLWCLVQGMGHGSVMTVSPMHWALRTW